MLYAKGKKYTFNHAKVKRIVDRGNRGKVRTIKRGIVQKRRVIKDLIWRGYEPAKDGYGFILPTEKIVAKLGKEKYNKLSMLERLDWLYENKIVHQDHWGTLPYMYLKYDPDTLMNAKDIWEDIEASWVANIRNPLSYPTKKPVDLIQRCIEMTTNKGDLVMDCFCGAGTTLQTSLKLERNCIAIDQNPYAIKCTKENYKLELAKRGNLFDS